MKSDNVHLPFFIEILFIQFWLPNIVLCSLQQAGLPSGVLNVVSGFGPTAGAALSSHMDVDKVVYRF